MTSSRKIARPSPKMETRKSLHEQIPPRISSPESPPPRQGVPPARTTRGVWNPPRSTDQDGASHRNREDEKGPRGGPSREDGLGNEEIHSCNPVAQALNSPPRLDLPPRRSNRFPLEGVSIPSWTSARIYRTMENPPEVRAIHQNDSNSGRTPF
jgi:hypothetical protein